LYFSINSGEICANAYGYRMTPLLELQVTQHEGRARKNFGMLSVKEDC
jgi:hypothetical protein